MQMSLLPASNTTGIANPEDDSEATNGISPVAWQRQLASAIRDSNQLLKALGLPEEADVSSSFPTLVPLSFLQRMVPGDANDPLLKQVLVDLRERNQVPGFVSDPVGDADAKLAAGMLQKYEGRALLVTTGACAVHCRYCFRREYPYHDEPRRIADWQPSIDRIAADTSITEVILSGGDPLMLTDARLADLCQRLDAIPHLQRIRFHSRLPIVLPSRVTTEFLDFIRSLRSQVIMVVHANHANEIVGDCADVLRAMVQAGVPVLNQAVLLKGINDTADVLTELCSRLVNVGVMPYYLHQLDRVSGAAHFEVAPQQGIALIAEIAKRLPGYAVPKFVQELPGRPNKTPVEVL